MSFSVHSRRPSLYTGGKACISSDGGVLVCQSPLGGLNLVRPAGLGRLLVEGGGERGGEGSKGETERGEEGEDERKGRGVRCLLGDGVGAANAGRRLFIHSLFTGDDAQSLSSPSIEGER